MRICAPLNNEADPQLQQVEVATFFQLPSFQIIGLPSPEVAEAKERIRSAIEASGLEFPRKRIVLNLSPASIRKRGTGLDLAMALAVLSIGKDRGLDLGAWGELGLDGNVKPAGQLTRALYACWKGKLSYLILSHLEYEDALKALQWIRRSNEVTGDPPSLVPVSSLNEAWQFISSSLRKTRAQDLDSISKIPDEEASHDYSIPVSSLLPLSLGLERMIGVAAAGRHHLLLLGPRGTGKSHALEWLIHLQPPVTPQNRLKQILLAELGRFSFSPIRRVSSQVRPAALIGGATSTSLRPGEFSLAHGGLLIADELPEWSRDSREALREPLERGKVTLTRTHGSLELPAQFLLAANGNICPCGGWPRQVPGNPLEKRPSPCKCSTVVQRTYLSKLSGPVLDRIDLVSLLTEQPLSQKQKVDSTEKVRLLKMKVNLTQKILRETWGDVPGRLSGAALEEILHRHPAWIQLLSDLSFASLRSRHKIVRVALTLSAWDGIPQPSSAHFTEAFCYRPERHLFLE